MLGFCTVHPEFVIGETKAVARMHTLWTNRPGLTRYEIGPFKQQKENVEEALKKMSEALIDPEAPVKPAILLPQFCLVTPGLASPMWHAWLTTRQARVCRYMVRRKMSYKSNRNGNP